CLPDIRHLRTTGVAARADFEFAIGGFRTAPHGYACGPIERPMRGASVLKQRSQSRFPGFETSRLRPTDMVGTGPVTRFAAHADFGPRRFEGAGRSVVPLAHVRRMTVGAHQVPVLLVPGPVQRISGLNCLVRVEMKPALSALFGGASVPRDAQR